MTNRYFIFAGETSGDLHGSHLMQALKKFDSTIDLLGVGGPAMRKEGLNSILKMENFQVMGFTDVIKTLPKLCHYFFVVKRAILRSNPSCVILIDYPGFNLRMAQSLRNSGFKGKIVQYICPSVWAHGKARIDTMVKNLDLLLTIYPFEAACFAHTPLSVKYIGNPLIETIQNYSYDDLWHKKINLPLSDQLVALFPGSRIAEIKKNLPLQLTAANLIKKVNPQIHFALSYTNQYALRHIQRLVQQSSLQFNRDIHLVPQQFTYELMRDSRTALAKSGTVTLELALHSRPSAVMYQLSNLNYLVAKYILRLNMPYYCIVNILGNKEIFPELIGKHIPPANLYEHLEKIHHHDKTRKKIMDACHQVRTLLGQTPAHQNAAKAIQDLLC